MAILFTWDPGKAERNASKHGVSFQEALSVFRDPLARIHSDDMHSLDEERELIIGHSGEQRLLVVSFAERGATVRLISARVATTKERRDYEQSRT